MKRLLLAAGAVVVAIAVLGFGVGGHADDLACVSTTFNLLSPNDKVCVSDFADPRCPA